MCGAMPQRIVSISGSSGTDHYPLLAINYCGVFCHCFYLQELSSEMFGQVVLDADIRTCQHQIWRTCSNKKFYLRVINKRNGDFFTFFVNRRSRGISVALA